MSATADLLDFAAAPHRLPAAVRSATRRCVADTLAVGAAGWSGPGMAGVLATAQSWGNGGTCRLLGDTAARWPANGAAYANCFAIHGLEWDAVHEGAVVHAMTAVVPAVLAAIDRGAASHGTDEVLAAIAVGVDVAAGLGLAASGGLRFFRPAITGIYGAALAVARLEGLTREQFADAGLAAQAARVEIVDDGNPDPNAMAPQRVAATFADGATLDLAVPVTLGSPERPLDAAGSAAKYGLCRALAPGSCDPRIFDDPIDYLVRT